jgi:hypothetical protein
VMETMETSTPSFCLRRRKWAPCSSRLEEALQVDSGWTGEECGAKLWAVGGSGHGRAFYLTRVSCRCARSRVDVEHAIGHSGGGLWCDTVRWV